MKPSKYKRVAFSISTLVLLGIATATGHAMTSGSLGGGSGGPSAGHNRPGGSGSVLETEPNNHLPQADPLGILFPKGTVAALGQIGRPKDLDFYRIHVVQGSKVDLRVLTGAASIPVGPTGPGGGPLASPSFLPIVTLFAPDGQPFFTYESAKPNLLLKNIPLPFHGADIFVLVAAAPGSRGSYSMRMTAQ